MKRSTYIIGGLFVAGIVIIVSILAIVRIFGTPYDYRGITLSSEGEILELPDDFSRVSVTTTYLNREGKTSTGINLGYGEYYVDFECDSTVTHPVMVYPSNLADSVVTNVTDGQILIDFRCPGWNFNTSEESVVMTIKLPVGMPLEGIDLNGHAIGAHFYDINTDNLKVANVGGSNVEVWNCNIDSLYVKGFDKVSVKGVSDIGALRVRSRDYRDESVCIDKENSSNVAKTILVGKGGFYLQEIDNYEVVPDSLETISVKNKYIKPTNILQQ